MKKILFIFVLLSSMMLLVSMTPIEPKSISTTQSDFCQGWEVGYCEGWRDVKGQYVPCPVTPVCPIPEVNKNTYNAGYNRGFSAGKRAAN